MCCFSALVNHVAERSISCRMGAKGNQVVKLQLKGRFENADVVAAAV